MLHKLRIHLIRLYTVMTYIILSIIVFGVCYLNIEQIKKNSLENFEKIKDTIIDKLETDTIIDNVWLSKLESSNKLLIHIEDNGIPFFFQGSWKPSTSRVHMITVAKKAAFKEGINTSVSSLHSKKMVSSVLHLRGIQSETALSYVCILPNKNGYLSLTLVQFFPGENNMILKEVFFYLCLDLLGGFALFLVSWFFVNRALKPVEESQRKQNEFIAAASHDLRSPLAVIQSNATSLLIDGADPHRFVPKIVDECNHMSRLINDMLILASSDAKSWQIKKEQIDTETYLIDLYDSFTSYCQKNEHELFLDLPDATLPPIYVDKGRLTQVLGILIDNAINYSPSKSTITLRPYIKKNSFCIEVEDHGIGIPTNEKDAVFDRFYRSDKARNDNTHYGLGLSVAKELIELQNGKINIRDTLNGGTTFLIKLLM